MALDDKLEFKLLAYKEEIPEFYSLTTCAEAGKHPERVTKAYRAFPQVDQDYFCGVRLKNGFLLPSGEKYLIIQTYREELDCKLVSKPKSGEKLEKDDCLIALAYAAEHDDVKEVQELVKEAGKDILRTRMPFADLGTILHICTEWASATTLAMVLRDYRDSVDVNILDKDGDTALHNLPNTRVPKSYEFCEEATRLLLPLDGDNGKQLLSKTGNYGGFTALHKALLFSGSDHVCRALLHAGKEVYSMGKQEKEVPAASSSPTWEASKDAPHWLAFTGRGCWIADAYNDEDVNKDYAYCTALHLAVLKEYGEIVKMILEFPGADVLNLTIQQDHRGNTPLHLAARVGNFEICSMLLIQISMCKTKIDDGGSAVKSVNKDGETSLHIASTLGHVEVCKMLLKYDSASLSMPDNHGRYALTNALARDKPEVVRILLDACFPTPPTSSQPNSKSNRSLINERFEFGLTPLHVAVAISSTDHIRRLIEAGALLGTVCADSRTPLHIASQQYEYREAFSTLLEAAGKKLNGQGPIRDGQKGWINMRDTLGKTALHNVVMLSRQSAKHQGARCSKRERSEMEMPDEGTEILEIRDGESVTLEVPYGEVDIAEICEMVVELLKKGAWVDVQDYDGETALHEAMRSHIDIVGTLLSHETTKHNFRMDIDNKDKWIAMSNFSGETALHEAVRTGQVEFVKKLLENTQSCDDLVRVRDKANKTAMDYAALSGYHEMMDVMMKKVEMITREFLIWNLKEHTNPHVHRRYCRKYKIEENQTKLLQAAVDDEDVDIARELINKGADVTSLNYDDRHWLAHIFGKKASDQPTSEDTLGRKELVQGVAALLLNPYTQTPITIGIFGSWGTGKSSFMLQVEESMLHMAVKEIFRKIPYTLSHDKGSSEPKFSKRGAILRRMVDKALKKHKTEADEYNQSDRIFILLAKIITVAQRLSIPSTDIESQNTSKEVDNMKESRYRQFFEDMESTHVQKWDTNTINNCPQPKYEQLFRDLASIDKDKSEYDKIKNFSKKFHSKYRQLFKQLASTNIQKLGKNIKNLKELQEKYHQLFKDLASIDELEYDWINDFRMELQSNYHQLLRDLALTDRSKLVCSHEGSWFKRKNAYEIGYTPAVLTMNYNAWQYDNKTEASAGLAVEISHQLESFMTPHQWLRMCWKFSWKIRPRDTCLHLLLPAFLALVAACVMVLFWKLAPIATKFKAISLPTSIVGVMWALFQMSLKAIQPVTHFMLSRTKSIDHQSMLGYQHQVIDDIKFLKDQLCQDAHFGWKILSIFCRLFISNTYFMDDTWIWKQHPHLNNLRIVVFIDDLDRCDEKTILEVLRAINLILGSCGINVVIGVDKGMVERAIMREFLKDNGDKVFDILAKNKDIKIVPKTDKLKTGGEVESVDKLKTDVKETDLQKEKIYKNEKKQTYTHELAENYLEKIIQVPIQMPDPSKKHIERFVQEQVGDHLTKLQKAQKRKQKENMQVEDKPAKDEGSSQRQEVIEESSEEDHVMNEGDSQGHVKLEDGASDSIVFRSLLANYTPMEKDMFGRLCQLETKEQRVPRQWKRFFTYHRLAWTIFSQDSDMRSQKFKGWQRKLILWIFICWNWRDQMDVIFENWHAIISKSSERKEQIYLPMKKDKNARINLKLCDIINIYMKDINPNTGDVKVLKDWIDLQNTLKEEYDIPMYFIEKFQQFRFYCKMNHLEIDDQ